MGGLLDSSRKRGRPSSAEVMFISSQILRAAREIFKERPFDEVSMEAIAARAGVKKNTLYKRFADKRAVLSGVMIDQLAQWSSQDTFVEAEDGLEDNLRTLARRLMRHAVTTDVRMWSRLADTAWPGYENLQYRRDLLGYNIMLDRLERMFGAAPGVPAADAGLLAAAFMDILTGWTDSAGQNREVGDDQLGRFADAAVDLILRGCLSR